MTVPNTVIMRTACHWELDTAIRCHIGAEATQDASEAIADPIGAELHDSTVDALNEAVEVPVVAPF